MSTLHKHLHISFKKREFNHANSKNQNNVEIKVTG